VQIFSAEMPRAIANTVANDRAIVTQIPVLTKNPYTDEEKSRAIVADFV
jgi:hypothetical protein